MSVLAIVYTEMDFEKLSLQAMDILTPVTTSVFID